MRQELKCGLIVLLLTGICAVECPGKAKKVPPDPKFTAIQNISVLPISDIRAGDKTNVDVEWLQGMVVRMLDKQKHYPASAASTSGDAGQIAVEDLESATPSYVKELGPVDARWVMVICLNDVAQKIGFGSTTNAELSGYLFDKDNGELVWKGKGMGQRHEGTLMALMTRGTLKKESLGLAAANLLKGMPNRPKPGK